MRCVVPGVLQNVSISKVARGLICSKNLIISNIISGFHVAVQISKTKEDLSDSTYHRKEEKQGEAFQT